jgi:hypothetical protein
MRPVVFCEFNDILLRDAGSSSQQLLKMFEALGYSPVTGLPPLEGKVVDVLLVHGKPYPGHEPHHSPESPGAPKDKCRGDKTYCE